jgi:superfamily II DNA or RNA helicase
MAPRFRSDVTQDGVQVTVADKSFFGRENPLPRTAWGRTPAFRPAVRTLEDLVERGAATATNSEIHLSSETAAALGPEAADRIGLPPLAPLGLGVALDSRIEKPDGRLFLRWTERTGQEVRPERAGLKLTWGAQSGRLSAPLLRIAQAAEAYNQTIGQPPEDRIASWMPVQTALKDATGQDIKRDGYLETFAIYQAGSFALDVHQGQHGEDFTPILMSRDRAPSLEDDAPVDEEGGSGANRAEGASDTLLSADDHRSFLEQAMKAGPTRDAYVIGKNRYVLIDPTLKPALDVVKAKRRAPVAERRAFLRNPKAALAEALDSRAGTVPTASLFIETKNYSDRVEGLGLWERPRLPWLARAPNQWLPDTGWSAGGKPVETAPFTPDELAQIERDVEQAKADGKRHVIVRGVPIPLDAMPQLIARERKRTGPKPETPSGERIVLLIKKTNFDGVDYTFSLKQRPAFIAPEPPAHCLRSTTLKPHQVEGFRWLADAWTTGWPGVLLADDMGLGKTLQALVFLAWIRSNAAAARKSGSGSVAGKPLLVVAPTALLKNWEKECAERLSSEGLGERADAYGKGLAKLKLDASRRSDPGETLDVARLREADWILTTYETLTDHELAFARIHYPVVIFDEMQKVKAPDTLNTKAARALNADFVLGLTGTPIENRMEDLWCIFDRIVPGYLGDLKTFSRTCRPDAPEELEKLKATLDAPVTALQNAEGAPPVMKRRMKADVLDALPKKEEKKYPTPMPAEQAQAYRALIVEASGRGEGTRGHMLDVLHRMRGISLHPRDPAEIAGTDAARFESFARRSARLSKTIEILKGIQKRREKALIFIEHLAMQDAIADGIAALFDLDRKPAVINGGTPGEKRLAIVDAFAQSGDRFGVLLLSPKAAGVGLNIVAANHVIHLSRWWNPAIEDQCNDRAYRIGQTKPVTIHIPLATHPDFPDQSFDEQLDRLIESKRQLSRHMLAPPAAEQDIEQLFKRTVK